MTFQANREKKMNPNVAQVLKFLRAKFARTSDPVALVALL